MNELERKLRSLSLGEPSAALRDRIFNAETASAPVRNIHRERFDAHRIPLAWAAALAVFCAVAGYGAGRVRPTGSQPFVPPASVVKVEIVETTNSKNMFDFTAPANDFLPGKVNVVVTSNGEV